MKRVICVCDKCGKDIDPQKERYYATRIYKEDPPLFFNDMDVEFDLCEECNSKLRRWLCDKD